MMFFLHKTPRIIQVSRVDRVVEGSSPSLGGIAPNARQMELSQVQRIDLRSGLSSSVGRAHDS